MKVLHVIDSGGLYGAETMLLNLIAEQLKMGLEPVIASIGEPHIAEKPLECEALRRGMRVEKFRMRPGLNILGAIRVLRFAWRGKFDMIHSHGFKANIILGMIPRAIRKLPIVATLHGWTSTKTMNRVRLYQWVDSLSLHFIEKVVLVNDAMRIKVKHHNLHVVNNGIPIPYDIHVYNSEEGQTPLDCNILDFCREGFIIGAIGRLSEEKGFEYLLEAVKRVSEKHRDIRLIILGAGYLKEILETQAKKLGIDDRVLLPGYQERANRYLPCFDVFALSSLTEGLPMVILEAMQAGVPIVATRVGGVPEVLANGEAGILVNSSDSVALSEGIFKLVKDSELCSRLAEKAKIVVRENYSSKRMAEEYQRTYSDLIKSPLEF